MEFFSKKFLGIILLYHRIMDEFEEINLIINKDEEELYFYLINNHIKAAEYLLKEYLVINQIYIYKLIVYASTYNHINVIDYIIQYDDRRGYLFLDSVKNNNINLMRILMKNQLIDVTENDNNVIRYASTNGHLAAVKELLKDSRIDPSTRSNEAIVNASMNGHLEIVKELLKDPRVNPSDMSHEAIYISSEERHFDIMRELLKDYRVNPSIHSNELIKTAAYFGEVELVKELLKDSRVDPSDNNNEAFYSVIDNDDESMCFEMEHYYEKIIYELLQDYRVISDSEIFERYEISIYNISLEQQLVNFIDIPLELCEMIQLYIYRSVY
jgi:ankyrin repeat protein